MTIKGKLSFKPNNNSVLLEILKFLLLPTGLALSHLSTDKMIAFMNQSCREILIRPQKIPTSLALLVQSTTQESLLVQPLDILNCLMDHLRFGKWNSYGFPHLMCINVLVMIFILSHCTEAFPYRQATASYIS